MQNVSALFFAGILLFLAGCSKPEGPLQHTLPKRCSVYDMKQAACISQEELVRRLAPYRVVFVGDYHDSVQMHAALARLLEALGHTRHVLLANEWFTPVDDALLSQYASGTFEGNFTKAIGWQKKAGYPFASYAPVYNAVKNSKGALFGINMDISLQKAFSENNDTNLSDAQRRFYRSLDMNLSAHRALLRPFFAHCHAKHAGENARSCAERMYRVQVAWDTYMAQQSAILASKQLRTSEDLLVVFAGAMHLEYGVGINARFARRSSEPFVTLLPAPEGTAHADVGEADYLLFYKKDKPEKEKP